MRKKIILVVMNCAGDEIIRYLKSSKNINRTYDIIYFPMHGGITDDLKDPFLVDLANADVLITQNVIFKDWLKNDYMKQVAK